MSHFLLAWELGGALGHVATLLSLATPLLRRGHRVTIVAQNPDRFAAFAPELCIMQVPVVPRPASLIQQPSTFADILSNAGWEDADPLQQAVRGSRDIFDQTKPDVIVGNFAPTTLLAAQGLHVRFVLFGTGFHSPPDVSPLPDLCPGLDSYADRQWLTERRVLGALNCQLKRQGVATLDRISQLFLSADANLLATYAEMDHYPKRPAGEYVGPWGELPGDEPQWPAGAGPKVFAYLKDMEALPYLLRRLNQNRWPTILYAPEAGETVTCLASATLCIASRPLNIQLAAESCDLAILNAGHNASLRLLVSGKPVLALPLSGEQQIVSRNIERLRAGIEVSPNQPTFAVASLDRVATDPTYADGAQAFAARYASIDRHSQIDGVVDRVEELA